VTHRTPARDGGLPIEGRPFLWGVLLLAFVTRVAAAALTVGFPTPAALEPSADSRIHMALAESLMSGAGFSLNGAPTAITPPLYIYLLAAFYRLFGSPEAVRIAQAAIGAASCGLVYGIGRRVLNPAAGLVGAAILAVSPVTALVAALHLTENLFLPLVLLTVWQALNVSDRPTNGAAVALGVLMGLTALTRSVFLAFAPFFALWAAIRWGVRASTTSRVVLLGGAAMTAVLVPWAARNYAVYGETVLVQSNGGMVFWAGNNPNSDGGLTWPTASTWTATAPPDDGAYGWRDLSVAQENRRYVDAAVAWIRAHPADYARLLARKMERLYGVSRAATRGDIGAPAVVVLFQIAFYVLAAAGLVLARPVWRRMSILLLLVVFTNVTVLAFSGSTRYGMPMMPALCLLAALPITALARRVGALPSGAPLSAVRS
jgi:4-amino-4-deoxy-L-arabinose transferase-like glycosyltransferase